MYLTYILSNNNYEFTQDHEYTFSEVLSLLSPILFDKQSREGIVLISENLLSYHKLAYIIFGKNKKRAYELETQMEQLLRV